METFKTKATVKNNHKIQIDNVPFKDGETVVITVDIVKEDVPVYPLWGTTYKYDNPFEPAVPPEEWEVLDDPD